MKNNSQRRSDPSAHFGFPEKTTGPAEVTADAERCGQAENPDNLSAPVRKHLAPASKRNTFKTTSLAGLTRAAFQGTMRLLVIEQVVSQFIRFRNVSTCGNSIGSTTIEMYFWIEVCASCVRPTRL